MEPGRAAISRGSRALTPSATQIFKLIETDIGRSLFHTTHGLQYPTLAADVEQTFQTLDTTEREVQSFV
ncbi:PAS domain-containing protein [Caballeronia mineralivorans]|jgi:two-component system CheB/CheR fusion protein|uniref:PAS domain-containing protein n=1 Tax=Caballeronia mineralivorans TaxID=2010198 RepID=UPI002B10AE22|nr:two-component system, chemotaxis family, CheB/CheR fusion protein [Caballeronia mineralivorans]